MKQDFPWRRESLLRIDVETDDDILQRRRRRGILLHDERIMPRNDVAGRAGEALDLAKRVERIGDVHHGYEWAVFLDVLVVMARIGGKHDVTALRVHPRDLKAGRMARREMQGKARREFHVAVVHLEAALEVHPHHTDHVFLLEAVTEIPVAHEAAGREGHLALLDMEARMAKLAEVADVVVVQMRDEAVGDRIKIDIEELHAVDRASQKLPATASAYILGEPGVDQEDPIRANDGPGEVVHRHGPVVRITADEVVGSQ